METTVEIYDTTLRDGTQQEGLSLTARDKLRICELLDDLGVHYIEGGWPGSNPKDDEFFARAGTELDLGTAVLTAFGSTRRPGGSADRDDQLRHLLEAGTEVVCIVGKSWDYHVREALRTDLDEALRMTDDSITFLRERDRRVFFDAEHFFDGYGSAPEFALAVVRAAVEAGAERVVLCDTNGGTLPFLAEEIVEKVLVEVPEAALGCHFHDDAGCAVASSLAAVRAGVRQVQGCLNGYGERTGNADLAIVIPDLVLKMGVPVLSPERLARLTPIAHHVADLVNAALDAHHPYVGGSAFTHKAGLHTSALVRRRDAYEHVDPALVGNRSRMVVSELAGRSTLLVKAAELGLELDEEDARRVLDRVKELEHRGYHFEAADGSFELLVRSAAGWNQPFFALESFRVQLEHRPDPGRAGAVPAEATVEVSVRDRRTVTTREGNGPVHALDRALRAALVETYPEVERLRLTDYRVRVLDSGDGTDAVVRVLIEMADGVGTWGTIGVHENIIEASWEALRDGIVVGLLRMQRSPGRNAPNT